MSYNNENSSKPFERASKTAHTHIINDPDVQAFISSCDMPPFVDDIDMSSLSLGMLSNQISNPIKNIFVIDGGYSDVIVRPQFPSATFAFFQFGALYFTYKDLVELEQKPFIEPSDISKLQRIERFKLSIPTKGIALKTETDLISSVRKSIYDFFCRQPEQNGFMSSLAWLVFEKYNNASTPEPWHLSACPLCRRGVDITSEMLKKDYTFECTSCLKPLYLTDIFRLHEAMDNELGAGGILGYLTTTIEQVIIVYIINKIMDIYPKHLSDTLFVKDGPLGFFGQTANIHKPMRKLIDYLQKKHNLYLVGLEKSGPFVEHAIQVSPKLSPNQYILLGNDYIYKYIKPGKPDEAYGSTSLYGHKMIFKSKNDNIYVVTVPSPVQLTEPKLCNYKNLDVLLENITALKCDLYSNSLIPIVLVNKLVSLASHPSSDLLKSFVQNSLNK